jgi:uncharacterized membrane protein
MRTHAGRIVAIVALGWTAWMLFLGLDDRRRVVGFSSDQSAVLQHLVAFAVLGALITFIVPWKPAVVWVAVAAAAILGEVMQLSTANRDFSIADIAVGAMGAGAGVAVGMIAARCDSHVEIAALLVPGGLMIASTFLLVVDPEPPETTFPEDCMQAPERITREPRVLIEETDLATQPLPIEMAGTTAVAVRRQILDTNELSVEIWYETTNLSQSGPVRLFTISTGTSQTDVNLHVGIENDDLSVRLRTSCELFTWVQVDDIVRAGRAQHAVVTWSAGVLSTWANGVLVNETVPRWGDFERWDPDARIIVGDEAGGGRRFDGTVYSVTMWDAALGDTVIKARATATPG